MDYLLNVAEKVDKLISMPANLRQFREQVESFLNKCYEAEAKVAAKSDVAESLEIPDDEVSIELILPPICSSYHTHDLTNSIFGSVKKEYSDQVKLQADYTRLAIIHDNALIGDNTRKIILNTFLKKHEDSLFQMKELWDTYKTAVNSKNRDQFIIDVKRAYNVVEIYLQGNGGKDEISIDDAIHLEEDQVQLLNWFNDQYPSICFVKRYSKRDEKTNYKNAKYLEKKGLLKRPANKKRGYIITDMGRQHIEQYYS
jgi:hypothetical protein